MSKSEYVAFLAQMELTMRRARALGLYRTTEKLHAALNEARSEMYEAIAENPVTNDPVTVDFVIGPVRDRG